MSFGRVERRNISAHGSRFPTSSCADSDCLHFTVNRRLTSDKSSTDDENPEGNSDGDERDDDDSAASEEFRSVSHITTLDVFVVARSVEFD